MSRLRKYLYLIKRFGDSIFTYDCAFCGKMVGGTCLCEKCAKKLEPTGKYYNGFACAYYYESAAREVLLRFKFKLNYEYCVDSLCDWLLMAYDKLDEKDFDAAVPVPAFENDETRLCELCRKFSLMADIPYKPELLHKIRKTEKQHNLSSRERRLNIVGAFSANESVLGKKILLVDDILTTGSTVSECANALYDKGAEKVCIITVLKTRYDGK